MSLSKRDYVDGLIRVVVAAMKCHGCRISTHLRPNSSPARGPRSYAKVSNAALRTCNSGLNGFPAHRDI